MNYSLCTVTCGYDVVDALLVVGCTQWYDVCECYPLAEQMK